MEYVIILQGKLIQWRSEEEVSKNLFNTAQLQYRLLLLGTICQWWSLKGYTWFYPLLITAQVCSGSVTEFYCGYMKRLRSLDLN